MNGNQKGETVQNKRKRADYNENNLTEKVTQIEHANGRILERCVKDERQISLVKCLTDSYNLD